MPERIVELDAHPHRYKLRLRVAMAVTGEAMRRLALADALQARKVGEISSLWLGPDQWLLVSDRTTPGQLAERCSNVLGSLRHHAVDVSAELGCATLRGAGAHALLAMGSGIDWHRAGTCVRTRFAGIPLVAHGHGGSAFDLYYDRSYRHYLERWFAHALTDPLVSRKPCHDSSSLSRAQTVPESSPPLRPSSRSAPV
jgi:heterotetrameric sarcosine oxidase gamma subunit